MVKFKVYNRKYLSKNIKYMQVANKKKIVIIGGGYAGLQSALYLNTEEFDVTLIDKTSCHEILPELPHLITDKTLSTEIAYSDLLKNKDVDFIQETATQIDYSKNIILLSNQQEIKFDKLILAVGATTNYFGISGLEEYSLPFINSQDVQNTMTSIKASLQKAAELGKDHEDYKLYTSIVVGGGGLTGVEVTGELILELKDLCAEYNLDYKDIKIYFVEGMDKLLPAIPKEDEKLSLNVTEFFKNNKTVELVLNEFITEAQENTIKLKSGREIKAGTILWTGGIRGSKFFDTQYINSNGELTDWELQRGFRIEVNNNFEITQVNNTYCVGDVAWAINPSTEQPYIQTGQIAYKQGRYLAKYINRKLLEDKDTIIPEAKSEGVLVSLGKNNGTGIYDGLFKIHLPVNIISRLIKKVIESRYKIFDIRK